MNNIETVLVDAIEKAGGAIGQGVEMVIAEAPDLISQLLMWNAIRAGVFACMSVVAASVALYLGRRLYKWGVEENEEGGVGFGLIVQIVGGGTSAFVLTNNLLTILQIWIAPKIWLIEYATGLVKN